MDKQEFETYRFGVNTRVLIDGLWRKVTEVDFEEGKIGFDNGYYLGYEQFEAIKEE
jgi:hypothetical protein